MSTHVVPRMPRDPLLLVLASSLIRQWTSVAETAESLTITYVPDLTAQEQAKLDQLIAYCRSNLDLTPEVYLTLEPFLAAGRAFQQLSQSDFIALGQNARDRMLHENVTALWRVVRAMLRD